MGGRLRAGDLVDVYRTEAGAPPTAEMVATGVPIVWVAPRELGDGGDVDLVIGVPDRGVAAAVVAAAGADEVALVRATGVGPADVAGARAVMP